MPQDLLEQGQLIAKFKRRNFSNYIADLIASDLVKSREWFEECKKQKERKGKLPPPPSFRDEA